MTNRRIKGVPDGLHLLDSEVQEIERRLENDIHITGADRKWLIALLLLVVPGILSGLAQVALVVFFSMPVRMNLFGASIALASLPVLAFLVIPRTRKILPRARRRQLFMILRELGHNVCPRCGYLCAGLDAAATCPECGTGLDGE